MSSHAIHSIRSILSYLNSNYLSSDCISPAGIAALLFVHFPHRQPIRNIHNPLFYNSFSIVAYSSSILKNISLFSFKFHSFIIMLVHIDHLGCNPDWDAILFSTQARPQALSPFLSASPCLRSSSAKVYFVHSCKSCVCPHTGIFPH